MALPKLNDVPKYELVIPSSGKKVSYRPFLVKEQKILLMALESQDDKQILRAITDTIKACMIDPISIDTLATFDVEYIFTQIRSKSAGETSTVNLKCEACDEPNELTINLEQIQINLDNQNKIIELTNEYTLVMKYPNYSLLLNSDEQVIDQDTLTETIFETIVMCMDELRTEDEIIKLKDESKKELENFLDGLNVQQLEKIMNFVNNLPRLEHDIEFDCTSCQHKNKTTLQGIQDFFS